MFGEALSLDGVNDCAVVNSSPGVSGGVQRTVSAWVFQDAGASNLRTAVALGTNGTGTKWDLDIDDLNGGIDVGASVDLSYTADTFDLLKQRHDLATGSTVIGALG